MIRIASRMACALIGLALGATLGCGAGPASSGDADRDRIPDAIDACPETAEDFDGFEDDDGCPDADNDGDGLLDVDDKCPDEPEVMDGCDYVDGCPGSHCKPGVRGGGG